MQAGRIPECQPTDPVLPTVISAASSPVDHQWPGHYAALHSFSHLHLDLAASGIRTSVLACAFVLSCARLRLVFVSSPYTPLPEHRLK